MRIAQRVQQQWSGKTQISLKDQIINFEFDKQQEPESLEARVARSKATWLRGLKASQRQQQEAKHGN